MEAMGMNAALKITLKRPAALFFAGFYAIGILGLLVPVSYPVFIKLTPLVLLLSTLALLLFHSSENWKRDLMGFATIFLLGFTVEVAGESTGLIFGVYHYGDALGIKLFDVPLLIGLNWLLLTYMATAITRQFKLNKTLTLFVAPALMLVYDLVLEQVAPKMGMWFWQNSVVPLRNYMAWYFIALVFTMLLNTFKVNTRNPLAFPLFVCQFVFFILLMIFL